MVTNAVCTLIDTRDLLPESWSSLAHGSLWGFNPSLLKHRDNLLFAYRIIGADDVRRIGLCALDAQLAPVHGSLMPLSDEIARLASRSGLKIRNWYADPRLYNLAGRIFLYWNTGWHDPQNEQYLQELSPESYEPLGLPRLLLLNGPRRMIEKNWTFFGCGPFYCVYSVTPHRILEFSLDGEGPITFDETHVTDWNPISFTSKFGELRGGCPPQRHGDEYLSIVHALLPTHSGAQYSAAAYRFSAQFPFAPIAEPSSPLPLGNPFRTARILPALNPAAREVVYPSGACIFGDSVLISHGINDELCAMTSLSLADVIESTVLIGDDFSDLLSNASAAP